MKSPVLAASFVVALGLVTAEGTGLAQQTRTPDVMPPPSGASGPGDSAGAGTSSGSSGTGTSGTSGTSGTTGKGAAGYAYSDKPSAASAGSAPHTRYRAHGPTVNMPGFEQTADGGTRLFVQLSQTVPVEERKAQGSVTYVLKGASPRVHNNTNALVTVHFNTPVSRARLVPHGTDLLFVVDLRAAAIPVWKLNEGQDRSATLTIDFPKGEYLTAAGEPPAQAAASSEPGPAGGTGAPAAAPPAHAPGKARGHARTTRSTH